MRAGARDSLSGAVLLALAIGLYRDIPDQVETLTGDSLTPASLPGALSALIALLAALLLVQGLLNMGRARVAAQDNPADNNSFSARGCAYVLATAGVAVLYAATIGWLGYLLASALAAGALALLYGHRRWGQILLMMIIAPPLIMFFFRYTMLVLLPEGRLFE